MDNLNVTIAYVDTDGSATSKQFSKQTLAQLDDLYQKFLHPTEDIKVYQFQVLTPGGLAAVQQAAAAAQQKK